ncbi:MAG: DUF6382 domain-containing protein [Defluviitaleaceae bacterium]|nr:DUF6382 domain-containing protein [Defluviitaleaceae bacterium]
MINLDEIINFETRAGKDYLIINVKNIDSTSLRTILFSRPNFIPTLNFEEIDGVKSFSYDIMGHGFIPIKTYSNIKPLDFLEIMVNLTESLIQSYDYFLNPQNLLVDEKYIYFNPKTKKVRMIYIPTYDEFFTTEELSKSVYKLSRSLTGSPNNKDWQSVLLGLWDLSEQSSIYTIRDKYSEMLRDYVKVREPKQSDSLNFKNSDLISAPKELTISKTFDTSKLALEPVKTNINFADTKINTKKSTKLEKKLKKEEVKKNKKLEKKAKIEARTESKKTGKSSRLFSFSKKNKNINKEKAKSSPFGQNPYDNSFLSSSQNNNTLENYEIPKTSYTYSQGEIINVPQQLIPQQDITNHVVDDNLSISSITINGEKHYIAQFGGKETLLTK